MQRPDLSTASRDVLAYIEYLETELAQRKPTRRTKSSEPEEIELPPLVEHEEPTTINVISIAANGLMKRTPRHFYQRQRRAGMGVFDIELTADTAPARLMMADESQAIVLITNQARAYRVLVSQIAEGGVRSKGQPVPQGLAFRDQERIAIAVPDLGEGYLLIASERGFVRRLRFHFLGKNLRTGTLLFNPQEFGPPVSGYWTKEPTEMFVATQQGRALRFPEQLVPNNGCQAIRLGKGDKVVSVMTIQAEDGVFLLNSEGKGTVRLMSGFRANKAPGAAGKIAMKTDTLIDAFPVNVDDDIFALSRQGKIIRFQSRDIPAKEGVVQGVNCMALRADEVVCLTSSSLNLTV